MRKTVLDLGSTEEIIGEAMAQLQKEDLTNLRNTQKLY